MKIKKIIASIFLLLILAIIIYLIIISYKGEEQKYITRAQFSKAIALCLFTEEECQSYEKNYFEEGNTDWYVPYMNKLYNAAYIDIEEFPATKDSADKILTNAELKQVVKKLNIDSDSILDLINDDDDKDKVKYAVFKKIYKMIMQQLDTSQLIQEKTLTIVKINDLDLVNTSEGDYYAKGIELDEYIDKQIKVYIKENEIILAIEEISDEIVYNNAYIESYDDGKVVAYINGAQREFAIRGIDEGIKESIVDIQLKKGKVVKISLKQDKIEGKVLAIDASGVEIERYAKLSFTDDFKVYKNYGDIEMRNVTDILVGYDTTTFIVADGKICAAIITKNIDAENIRVLIKTSGFASLFHDSVSITCDGSYTVSYGETVDTYDAGSQFTLNSGSSQLANGRVKIQPVDDSNRLTLTSVNRDFGIPTYRGSIEVATNEKGLLVINELPLEEYLYSVVPSEMPVSYGLEALYVQAVCARTYAYRAILNNAYSQYGAHVDDSVAYQVYNNIQESDLSIQAVDDTYGKILTYNGEVIEAYFFSTSAGSTTDASVWGNSDLPYIKGKLLTADNTTLDLTNNEVFDSFIRQSYNTYDSQFPWYRWNCTISLKDLSKSINSNIAKRYEINKNNILTKASDGTFCSSSISSIGNLQKMEISKRGTGGVISELILYGSEKTVLVKTESNIRNLICVSGIDINKNDGSVSNTQKMLPSAYFTLEEVVENGSLTGYKLIGGGLGHGVGVSQNAVKAMVESGLTWEEILKYFYNEVDIVEL